jgi:Skp family chaperone for outer membrane proteins
MINKYLLIAIAILFGGCVLLYNLWDNTKTELKSVKQQKITLEQELKRRDENAQNLAKRIETLKKALDNNSDWASNIVPVSVSSGLCKPKCSD